MWRCFVYESLPQHWVVWWLSDGCFGRRSSINDSRKVLWDLSYLLNLIVGVVFLNAFSDGENAMIVTWEDRLNSLV